MRISDWSSDVCSSDLAGRHNDPRHRNSPDKLNLVDFSKRRIGQHIAQHGALHRHQRVDRNAFRVRRKRRECMQEADTILPRFAHPDYAAATDVDSGTADIVQRIEPILECSRGDDIRSEEHTTELQSLMRISYAVFCLKKKNK